MSSGTKIDSTATVARRRARRAGVSAGRPSAVLQELDLLGVTLLVALERRPGVDDEGVDQGAVEGRLAGQDDGFPEMGPGVAHPGDQFGSGQAGEQGDVVGHPGRVIVGRRGGGPPPASVAGLGGVAGHHRLVDGRQGSGVAGRHQRRRRLLGAAAVEGGTRFDVVGVAGLVGVFEDHAVVTSGQASQLLEGGHLQHQGRLGGWAGRHGHQVVGP